MPPEVIRELELHRHGLTLYPLAADYYVPFPDGSHLLLTKNPGQAKAEIGKFSRKDADAWPVFSEYLAAIARIVRPLLLMTPPAVGAKSPADLMELARFAWQLKGGAHPGRGQPIGGRRARRRHRITVARRGVECPPEDHVLRARRLEPAAVGFRPRDRTIQIALRYGQGQPGAGGTASVRRPRV